MVPKRETARVAGLAAALARAGCTADKSSEGAAKGAAVGAAVGTVAGAVLGDSTRGTLLGTAAGAAVGGAIGWLFAREETELKEVLAPQREAQTAAVERVGEDTLRVTIDEAEAFEPGSSSIREPFLPTLDRIAGVLEKYPQSRVTVVGFTDAEGAADLSQRLSLERAEAVRGALATYDIDPARMRAEGRGKAQPVADDATGTDRAENRQLEILIAPVA
jgi:outer membrane protein OmpA-like peptidoglycan-associated protein